MTSRRSRTQPACVATSSTPPANSESQSSAGPAVASLTSTTGKDGIGPQSQRPVRENKHWGGEEPNNFGTDEFLAWCEQVGADAYINANLGTGTLQECLDWLEYCHGAPDSPQGKRRAANRRSEPYEVDFWGLGNETFGKWEAGNMDAPTYSKTLTKWAAAVREKDS